MKGPFTRLEVEMAIRRWYADSVWARWYAVGRARLFLPRFRSIIETIPTSGRVIDIGCGIGLTTALIGLARPQQQVVGLDPNRHRIAAAVRASVAGAPAQYELADARTFLFQPGDTVVFIDVLHHIPYRDHHPLLIKIHQQVGSAGRLVIAEVDPEQGWRSWLSHLSDIVLYPWTTRCQYYTRDKLAQVLQEAGWRLATIIKTSGRSPFASILYVADAG